YPDRTNSEPKEVSHYAFDASNFVNSINIFDGFSTTEKYRALTRLETGGQDIDSLAQGNIYQVLAGRFDSLRVGEKRSMAFALVVGNSLSDIQNNAQSAQEQFFQIKQGPIPHIPASQKVCRGEDLVLQPNNGNIFSFYAQPPENDNIRPLFTGRSLRLANISNEQVIYVSNLDSLFESDYVTVNIDIDSPEAQFTPSQSTVNISLDSTLRLSNLSTNAESFVWTVQRSDGTNEGYAFQSGSNINSRDPVLVFNQLGNYEIQLISQSALGCTDSLNKTISVVQQANLVSNISTLLEAQLEVFPNPVQDYLQIQADRINREIKIEIFTPQGNLLLSEQFANEAQLSRRLDLSRLASGIYFLKVSEPEGFLIKKISKL
ncbi:MAG: T9SS type A sorting domain-containing protein, partial [Bacteroidota bacterium]